MTENKLCFLRQYEDKVVIFNNQFEEGFDIIRYKKVLSDTEKEIKTNNEMIILENIEESGEYDFYLQKDDEVTNPKRIYILAEKMDYTISKIEKYIVKPIDELYIYNSFEEIKKIYKNFTTITEALVDLYRKIEDIQKYEAKSFYQMISIAERYENIQTISMNEMLKRTSFKHGAISEIRPSFWVDYIDIIKKDNDLEVFIKRIDRKDFEDTVFLELEENSLYQINFYNANDLIGSFVHYRFDNKGLAYFWNEEMDVLNKIDETIFDDIQLNHADVNLTQKEKKEIIKEKIKEPRNWILVRPKIEEVDVYDNMTITINGFELLNTINRPFYLSLKEPELFLNDGFDRKIPITSKQMVINLNKHNLSDSVIISVKDDLRNTISKFARYEKDESYNELNQNKEKLESILFSDIITKKIKYFTSDNELVNNVSNNMYVSYSDSINNLEKLYFRTISYILRTDYMPVSRNAMIYLLIDEWMDQFDTDLEFFDTNTFYYSNITNELIFPPRLNDYTIVVTKFSLEDELPQIDYIKSSIYKNISINTKESELIIIYCIDNENYKRSGFYMINNIINEKCLISNKYNIEVSN